MRSRAAGLRSCASSTTRPVRNGTSAANARPVASRSANARRTSIGARLTMPAAAGADRRARCDDPAAGSKPFATSSASMASSPHRSAPATSAARKRRLHRRDHGVPLVRSHARLEAGVGHDLDLALEHADVEQHAGACMRCGEPMIDEERLRALARFDLHPRAADEPAREPPVDAREQRRRDAGAQHDDGGDEPRRARRPRRMQRIGEHHGETGERARQRERLPRNLGIGVRLRMGRADDLHTRARFECGDARRNGVGRFGRQRQATSGHGSASAPPTRVPAGGGERWSRACCAFVTGCTCPP